MTYFTDAYTPQAWSSSSDKDCINASKKWTNEMASWTRISMTSVRI